MSKATLICLLALFLTPFFAGAQDFMMQGWFWDYPKPANPNGNPGTESTWAKTLKNQAPALSQSGFTYIWLPPFSRASFGSNSNGYDPQDLYDLGEYGLGATGFGFRSDVDNLITEFNNNGIEAVADVVYNHRDGGEREINNAVKTYITSTYSGPPDKPYPSDRFRCVLPLGGSSGNGAGDYYFQVSSYSQHSDFHDLEYKIYMTTSQVGWQGLSDVWEVEPNGGGDCGEGHTVISLGRNFKANVDAIGCTVDEFKLTVNTGDFDPAGDELLIELTNTGGAYSDHRIFKIWSAAASQDIVSQLEYYTFTDFQNMPSGRGGMNFEAFRPNSGNVGTETLALDWNSMFFFYDYDQSQAVTRDSLFKWSEWLWNDVGIRGFRMDAVKHFDYAFTGDLLDYLHGKGIDPGMVVGEFYDNNAGVLNNWVNNVKNNMDPGTQAAIDVRVFDFAMRKALKDACDQFGYDVRNVFNSGIVDGAGGNPFSVVTFANNHDFRDGDQPIQNNPMLAYAYLLTNNQIGLPCVFYPDYFGVDLSPEYPVVNLKTQIDQLIDVHQTYIYQSSGADYLSRINTPYAAAYATGYPNTTLLFQLSGGIAGKEVLVAINFAGESLDVTHEINTTNVGSGDKFTDVLGNSTGPSEITVSPSGQLTFKLPPRSYSVWVEGSVPTLPATLLDFKATAIDGYVELEWEASNEQDLLGYVIERSFDGMEFQEIALEESIGKPGEEASYLFIDHTIGNAAYLYYRLKMVNTDDSYEYSDVKVAYFRKELSNIELVPNPVLEMANIQFDSPYNNVIFLEVYNPAGERVISEKIAVTQGFNKIPVSLRSKDPGVYFIKIHTPGQNEWTGHLVKGR